MKNLFLTSRLDYHDDIENERFSKSITNLNGIVDLIKEKLKKQDTFVFICSTPADYRMNNMYSSIIFDSFKMSGFNFKELIVVDYRYKGNLKEDIARSDLVFITGGNTLQEMKYLEEINLRDILKDYDKVIIGQSAGSLNLADIVVCSPEYIEEIGTDYTWKGLGLTNIHIEPHFITDKLVGDDILLRKELLELSNKYLIYALPDGSYIYDSGKTQTLYGEGYTIYKEQIKKICNKDESVKISD